MRSLDVGKGYGGSGTCQAVSTPMNPLLSLFPSTGLQKHLEATVLSRKRKKHIELRTFTTLQWSIRQRRIFCTYEILRCCVILLSSFAISAFAEEVQHLVPRVAGNTPFLSGQGPALQCLARKKRNYGLVVALQITRNVANIANKLEDCKSPEDGGTWQLAFEQATSWTCWNMNHAHKANMLLQCCLSFKGEQCTQCFICLLNGMSFLHWWGQSRSLATVGCFFDARRLKTPLKKSQLLEVRWIDAKRPKEERLLIHTFLRSVCISKAHTVRNVAPYDLAK